MPSPAPFESSRTDVYSEEKHGYRGDRQLIVLIVGALLLVAVGLVALPLIARRSPTLFPAATPEGVVQRFYQAAYAGDYAAAYALVSSDTRQQLSLVELQQQMSSELQHSQIRITRAQNIGDHATVWVTQTTVQPDGLFGSGELSFEREILLEREGEAWTISGGPFVVPQRQPTGSADLAALAHKH